MISVCLSAGIVASPAAAKSLSEGDRARLLAHLEMTEAWVVSELDGVTTDQLRFRMTSESWTITDVVEHLAIAEPQYWERVHASMTQPPAKDKPGATDAGILWYGIDRTQRAKTGEARVPQGRWANVEEPLASFRKLRATMKAYAAETTDDLRSRMLLEGNMDVYQWFLMISTHAQRHVLQIREIKAHPGYPRTPRAGVPGGR
jgi:hypothetical protein